MFPNFPIRFLHARKLILSNFEDDQMKTKHYFLYYYYSKFIETTILFKLVYKMSFFFKFR